MCIAGLSWAANWGTWFLFYYSLTCKPCLSWPFDPVGNGRLMRLTTFFGQIFFLTKEILLTSRPNYAVLTPVPKPSSLGAIFLIESFILPTLNKLLEKSRLKSIAGGCIWNGLQLDRLNVAIISVEGMPLSSLRLLPRKTNSEIIGARASAALQLLSAYVTDRYSGSRRAPREPEESVALVPRNDRSHGLRFLCFLLHTSCFLHRADFISSSLFSLTQCKKLRVLIPLQGFGWRAF